ncbi:MAG: hypothetical protein IKE75_03805 [Bacilli bacterium]|nr:hypothetical protein [Bacilli bacterium]
MKNGKMISLENKSIDELAVPMNVKEILKNNGITNYRQLVQCADLHSIFSYEGSTRLYSNLKNQLQAEHLSLRMSDWDVDIYEINPNSMLNKSIFDVDISISSSLVKRVCERLDRCNVDTYSKLARLDKKDLLNIHMIGEKAIPVIESILAQKGLHIGMSELELENIAKAEIEQNIPHNKENNQTVDEIIQSTEQENDRLTSEIEVKRAKLEKLQQLLEHKQELEEQSRSLDEQIARISEQLAIKTEENTNGKSRK